MINEREYETILLENGTLQDIKQSLSNIIPNSTKNTSKEYEESKELVEKLEEMPVEEAIQEVKPNNSTTQETNSSTNSQNTETNSSTNIENTQNNGTSNNGNSLTSTKNYVTSYNPETGTYEVYSVEEIINNSEEEPTSETEKIQANGLQQFYESYNTSGKKTKIEPGLVIIITTITAIGFLSIIILKRAKEQ